MASNKKPRKRHVRRDIGLPMTIRHNADADFQMQLMPHAELLKLREGLGDEATWHTIVCRLNVGSVLAFQNELPEIHILMRKALDCMIAIRDRFQRVKKWGISGEELKIIGDSVTIVDDLQLQLTRRQFSQALNYVYNHAAY